jgi:hypothetical protein
MLKKVISDERGRALVLALIVLGVGMLLIPTFLAHISTNLLAARATEVGITEYYASDAGIEYTLWQLKCNSRDFLASLGDEGSYTVPVGSKVVSMSLEQLSSGGGSNEVDAMLVLDRSTSMKDDGDGCTSPSCGNWADCVDAGGVWDSEEKDCTLPDYANENDCDEAWEACYGSAGGGWGLQPITSAKVAAKAFVDILDDYSVGAISHQVGLVSYSTSVPEEPDVGLTTAYTDVREAIDGMLADGWTDIGDAIALAADELKNNGRQNSVKAIVLLSDGKANRPSHPPGGLTPEEYAKKMADDACSGPSDDDAINFFTVALGTEVDTDLMQYIARDDDTCNSEDTDFYQYSPDSGELTEKFERIALYLAAPHYLIEATVGGTTIQSRVVVADQPLDMVGIITWLTR